MRSSVAGRVTSRESQSGSFTSSESQASNHEKWLEAIQAFSNDENMLEAMDRMLLAMIPDALRSPIAFRPPVDQSVAPSERIDNLTHNSNSTAASSSRAPATFTSASRNTAFSQLFDDGEHEDDETSADEEDAGRPAPNRRRPTAPSTVLVDPPGALPGHQARYVRFMIRIALAELLRNTAIEREKQRVWSAACSSWQAAFGQVITISIDADEWYAIFYSVDESRPPVMLQDDHHYASLKALLDSLDLLRSHTEVERDRAVDRFKHEHDRLLAEYDRMMGGRAEAKRQMGENQWNHNPAPKKTFVEKMLELRGEVKALEEAIDGIEALRLNSNFEDM